MKEDLGARDKMNSSAREPSPTDDGGDQSSLRSLTTASLTTRQRELLTDLTAGDLSVADTYPPVAALLDKGLAEYRETKWGGTRLSITETGRAAIAKASRP